jgi:hypothetical protein
MGHRGLKEASKVETGPTKSVSGGGLGAVHGRSGLSRQAKPKKKVQSSGVRRVLVHEEKKKEKLERGSRRPVRGMVQEKENVRLLPNEEIRRRIAGFKTSLRLRCTVEERIEAVQEAISRLNKIWVDISTLRS